MPEMKFYARNDIHLPGGWIVPAGNLFVTVVTPDGIPVDRAVNALLHNHVEHKDQGPKVFVLTGKEADAVKSFFDVRDSQRLQPVEMSPVAGEVADPVAYEAAKASGVIQELSPAAGAHPDPTTLSASTPPWATGLVASIDPQSGPDGKAE